MLHAEPDFCSMKIHINQIPLDGMHLEGEEQGDILEIQDETVRVLAPISYSLDLGLSHGGLFATGTLATELELECVCCLNRFRFPLVVPDFAVQVELTHAELVDLTENVREDILLALPLYPHCDWAGDKPCPGVRAIAQIQEQETAAEPSGESPWATLDRLNKLKDLEK